jgi:rhodanese-related sulfurtransferase
MITISWKQLGVALLVLLGVILAFSPVDRKYDLKGVASQLSQEIMNRLDHITAEQLGHMIIDKDPGFQLIDIRPTEEFDKFHINGALNLPFADMFNKENLEQLYPDKLLVLYSNGETHASQAWVLMRQLGYKDVVILLGGVNYWVDVYSNPTPPSDVYADAELFRYEFLVSAGNALLGGVQTENSAPPKI